MFTTVLVLYVILGCFYAEARTKATAMLTGNVSFFVFFVHLFLWPIEVRVLLIQHIATETARRAMARAAGTTDSE